MTLPPELGRALALLGLLVSLAICGGRCLESADAVGPPDCLRTRPPECRYARAP